MGSHERTMPGPCAHVIYGSVQKHIRVPTVYINRRQRHRARPPPSLVRGKRAHAAVHAARVFMLDGSWQLIRVSGVLFICRGCYRVQAHRQDTHRRVCQGMSSGRQPQTLQLREEPNTRGMISMPSPSVEGKERPKISSGATQGSAAWRTKRRRAPRRERPPRRNVWLMPCFSAPGVSRLASHRDCSHWRCSKVPCM